MAPELIYGVGALVLGLGIAYAGWRYATRDKSKDAITEAATREMKEHPDRYEHNRKDFERAAKED
ncbi:hypothetical protein [Terricaulis sp.]|uniref:hypothetical protein n=1 Tax=Terricaulis sp. TaxID=2768686 RepID=UPI002AC4DDB9|nr:hypothetical protein [Terricaulis sp.]MDZ4690260.1 hypothetical protein [Terricaulis sp.]